MKTWAVFLDNEELKVYGRLQGDTPSDVVEEFAKVIKEDAEEGHEVEYDTDSDWIAIFWGDDMQCVLDIEEVCDD